MGWALKQIAPSARFSQKIREYLTAKFNAGEKSGEKANSGDVEMDMRNSRDENNCRDHRHYPNQTSIARASPQKQLQQKHLLYMI